DRVHDEAKHDTRNDRPTHEKIKSSAGSEEDRRRAKHDEVVREDTKDRRGDAALISGRAEPTARYRLHDAHGRNAVRAREHDRVGEVERPRDEATDENRR